MVARIGMSSSNAVNRPSVPVVVAALLILVGLIANWRVAAPAGVDFPSLYEMGRGIANGTNIYDPAVAARFPATYHVTRPAGMFYPPATGFVMLPFALLPYAVGKLAWLLVMEVAVVLGIRSLVRSVAPQAASHVWMFCAAAVLLSSALRWGMLLLQGAPLLLGALGFFVAAVHGGRPRLAAAIATFAVATKMTLSLPFLGVLALQRRFVAAAIAGGTWVALNVLGFWRMGPSSLHDYRQSVGGLEAFGDINSPDPWNVLSSPRLDWTSLFYGLTGNISVSRLATLALAGLVALWLLREGWRARDPHSLYTTTLFLTPLVLLGSLCVYHHHYDSCLFFAPALALYFVFGPRRVHRVGALLLCPMLLMLMFLPIGVAQNIAQALGGVRGVGLLKLSFPIAVSAALVGSLIVLHVGEKQKRSPG